MEWGSDDNTIACLLGVGEGGGEGGRVEYTLHCCVMAYYRMSSRAVLANGMGRRGGQRISSKEQQNIVELCKFAYCLSLRYWPVVLCCAVCVVVWLSMKGAFGMNN